MRGPVMGSEVFVVGAKGVHVDGAGWPECLEVLGLERAEKDFQLTLRELQIGIVVRKTKGVDRSALWGRPA